MKKFVGEYAMELSFGLIGVWVVFVFLLMVLTPMPNDIPKKSNNYATELVEQYPNYDNVPQEKLREWYDIATKEKENEEAAQGVIRCLQVSSFVLLLGLALMFYKAHYDENC